MSKSGQINKYLLVKKTTRGLKEDLLTTEIWRMDNKNVHLHRIYDSAKRKFVYPDRNQSIKMAAFKTMTKENTCIVPSTRYEITEFNTKEEYYDGMFLEML